MKPSPLLVLALVAPFLRAQQAPAVPDDVAFRKATIISEGTRMSADVLTAKGAAARLPCILLAHGWGGTAMGLRPEAIAFARAGYLAVAFDYRGWGESESRVILTQPLTDRKAAKLTAEVQQVREVVDPIDMGVDWLNAIHWLAGEPGCDGRIGLWGSSFSGGLVVWAAARDKRVKALHSQVGSLDGRFVISTDAQRKLTWEESTSRARGQIGYPDPGARVIGNLRGAPIRSKFAFYAPVDEINDATDCAMQFVIAEKEELFDNRDHAIKAHERFRGEKRLVNIPDITHYGIYTNAAVREQSRKLAIEWYDRYVKGLK